MVCALLFNHSRLAGIAATRSQCAEHAQYVGCKATQNNGNLGAVSNLRLFVIQTVAHFGILLGAVTVKRCTAKQH